VLAGVVGVSVALAERAVDSVAGYAEDVAAGASTGGFGAGWRSVAVVAGCLAWGWVWVISSAEAGLAVHGCARRTGRLANKLAPTGGGCQLLVSSARLASPGAEHDVADIDAFGLGALFVQALLQGFNVDFFCGCHTQRDDAWQAGSYDVAQAVSAVGGLYDAFCAHAFDGQPGLGEDGVQVEADMQIGAFAIDHLLQPALRLFVQGKGVDAGRDHGGVVLLKHHDAAWT